MKSFSSKNHVNDWNAYEFVSELEDIDKSLSKTIIQLFEDEFTIPFLCRYRKDLINNLSPLRLREIKDTIDSVKMMEAKSASILKVLEKGKLLTVEIARYIKSAKSLDELEHLSQLYKPQRQGSLYERAQKIGLEPPAQILLYGTEEVNPAKFVSPKEVGLKTVQEVEEGIRNILSHLIARNELVMDEVRQLKLRFGVTISTSQVKQKKSAEVKPKPSSSHKFENYFNFSCPAGRIKPHQVLAINRGEALKAKKF